MRLRTHPMFGLQLLVMAMIGTFTSEVLANDMSALAVTIFTLPLLLSVPAGGSHHANGAALITMVIGVIASLWLAGHLLVMGLTLLAITSGFIAFRRRNATTALVVAIGVALGTMLFPHLVMNTWVVLLIYCLFIIGCHLIAKTCN